MIDQVTVEFGAFESAYDDVPGDPPPLNISGTAEVYSDAHLNQGSYNQYVIDHKYVTDTGLRVFPKAASGDDASVMNSAVRIHRGITYLEITWTCERANAKPKIPRLNNNDPNAIPIEETITFANRYQLGNGNSIYRVSGFYRYALLVPKTSSSKYAVGTTPAEIAPSAAVWYGPEDFSATIIDAAFAAPGGVNLQIPIRVGS